MTTQGSFPEKIKQKDLREKVAELEHEQWMEWSKDISQKEELSIDRLKRWQNLWKPYNELPEVEKEQDRVWADKVLDCYAEDQKERKQKLQQFDFEKWFDENWRLVAKRFKRESIYELGFYEAVQFFVETEILGLKKFEEAMKE